MNGAMLRTAIVSALVLSVAVPPSVAAAGAPPIHVEDVTAASGIDLTLTSGRLPG